MSKVSRMMFVTAALLGLLAVAIGFAGLLTDAHQIKLLVISVAIAVVAFVLAAAAGKKNAAH